MHQRLSFKRRKILFSYPECICCSKCILGQIEMNKPSSEIVFTEKCTCWRTFHKVPSGPARHLGPIQKMFICRRVRKETVKYFLLLNYISSELMLSLYSAYFLFTIHHSDSIQKLLTQSKNLVIFCGKKKKEKGLVGFKTEFFWSQVRRCFTQINLRCQLLQLARYQTCLAGSILTTDLLH